MIDCLAKGKVKICPWTKEPVCDIDKHIMWCNHQFNKRMKLEEEKKDD